ncbi:MAG: MATE family efflux transporter [Pseudomonadales bacterium]
MSAAPGATAPAVTARAAVWHRYVLGLTWPVLLANLTIPMVGTVDTAVMGRLPDPAYIGAVAVGATIFSALYWLFGFLRMGTTGLAAQAYGAANASELGAIAQRSLGLAIVIGGSLIVLQWPLQWLSFSLMGGSQSVANLAADYYQLRIWGAPAALGYLAVMGMLFGLQRMRDTLWLGLLLNVSNAVLDVLFVLGFDWGVQGVAAGTVISEWTAALTGLWLLRRALRTQGIELTPDRAAWQSEALRKLLTLSGDLIIRSFFVQAPFFAYTAIGARLGDLVLAANAILMQFFFIMIYALDAFAHSAETLSGNAFGAADRARFERSVRFTTFWAALLALMGGLLFGLASDPLIALLTRSAEVQQATAQYIGWLVIMPLASVWAFQLDGIFIGTTQSATMRNAMALAFVAFLLVLGAALPTLDNHGLWLALLAFMLARAVLLGRRYPALVASIQR